MVVTYAAVESISARFANYFISLGLLKGDRIAVQVEKSPAALLVYLGALRAGLVYLPLNTGYTAAELAYFFGDAEPGLVICDPAKLQTMQQLAAACGVQPRVETLDASGKGSVDSALLLPAEFTTAHCSANDLAVILYTSGTTGRPKGAMLSHRNLSSNTFTLHDYWGWHTGDVLLHALPIFHVHGLFVACHCVLAAGAQMIFLPAFDAQQVMRYLPQASVLMGVPTFYTRLLGEANFDASICNSVRLFISGSAPLLESTHREFEARSGHSILERYGMTETGMLTSNPLHGERRAGTVGKPLPDVQLRIVDTDNSALLAGEVGSIQVKGPNVFQGYWRMPGKTAEEFTADDFFVTGDQGCLSKDGYVSIVGRAKDMVISGGYNIYPKEVELLINGIAGVQESAVFGVAHNDYGEAVTAVVVREADSRVDADTIIATAKQSLANYKVPKRVAFLDALPRNTVGKVKKTVLRERFAS